MIRPMPRILLHALLLTLLLAPVHVAAEGIPIGLVYDRNQYHEFLMKEDPLSTYRQAIERSGGDVVILTPAYDRETLASRVDQMRGLLLPGGIDVDPRFYGEARHAKLEETDEALDRFEMELVRTCLERGIPVLGICRGCQLMAVHFGGSLYQDLPSQRPPAHGVSHRIRVGSESQPCFHGLEITRGSRLFRMLGMASARVNSYHHQAVKRVPPGFRITARAPDGVIEAIEATGDAFVVGVQFHPEWLRLEDPRFGRLFHGLVTAAAAAARRVDARALRGLVVPSR